MATTANVAAEVAEAVEEYESDPDEVKRSLVMRRREASDDEEEELEESERGKGSTRGMDRRAHIHSDDESDGQGGVPVDYDDEEYQDEELEEEEDEEGVYDEEEEDEEVSEDEGKEGEGTAGVVNIKAMESGDGRSVEGLVDFSVRDNDNEKNNGQERTEEGKKDSNEPFAVPTAGAFYMHDDRFRENVGGRHRRTRGGRKLWESRDDSKWGHDKFEEMTSLERHYDVGRRSSRGRYRGRGKIHGPDHGHPRGNRSKAFNNNNINNQNQAPKGVRGRGPRRYEPAWKKNTQAPMQQHKQSGKPVEKGSHTNSGRAFMPTSNAESDRVPPRKQLFASSLSSASPPFYPSGSSNKDISLRQQRDLQFGNTSRNLRASGMDENFTVQPNAMQRGKNVADISMDKLYIHDSSASAAGKSMNNPQMLRSSQSRSQGRSVAIPQQISYQSAPPLNQTNRVSPSSQLNAIQQSSSQNCVQPSVQSPPQQLGQHSVSGSQASSPPKSASVVNSNDPSEVESPSESSKSKGALVGKGKGSQGRGSFMYGGAQVMGATGNMTVAHGDQNFPTFLPVMQFGGQHHGGIGVPAVGMAFPGYVAQPQLGLGNSEMTWLPVLAGAAGALGATYCPPYIAVDGAYHPRPIGQTSSTSSSSKEITTNKPNNEWKPSLKTEPVSDEFGQQQNKPQPRRYSAMNLANDVLR